MMSKGFMRFGAFAVFLMVLAIANARVEEASPNHVSRNTAAIFSTVDLNKVENTENQSKCGNCPITGCGALCCGPGWTRCCANATHCWCCN